MNQVLFKLNVSDFMLTEKPSSCPVFPFPVDLSLENIKVFKTKIVCKQVKIGQISVLISYSLK